MSILKKLSSCRVLLYMKHLATQLIPFGGIYRLVFLTVVKWPNLLSTFEGSDCGVNTHRKSFELFQSFTTAATAYSPLKS